MKIGDEVYVHGYVDEIRGNTVIIKNKGGYFGTCKKEIQNEKELESGWFARVYPTDKFSVFVIAGKIHIVKSDEVNVTVTQKVTDCSWK